MIVNQPQNIITGIILAGGKSSRMGQEKGLMKLHNKTFIEHSIQTLNPIVQNLLIITNNKEYEKFGITCIQDKITDCGPAGGIYTGLSQSNSQINIFLSCDTPLVTEDMLRKLLEKKTDDWDIVHYSQNPLIGVYHKRVSSIFLTHLKEQQFTMKRILQECKTHILPTTEAIKSNFKNINTPEEYNKLLLCH